MAVEQSVYFRPSLIIFVGDDGDKIRRLFADRLLVHLDWPLRQSVGLIQYPVDGGTARSWLVDDMFKDPRVFPAAAPAQESRESTPIESLRARVDTVLNSVQAEHSRITIQEYAGYEIINQQTQIYIVGRVDHHDLGDVLKVVRERLAHYRLNTEVCYILSRYQPNQAGPANWVVQTDWDNREVANFCFIYENAMRSTNPATGLMTEEQSHYAAAEALLALVATGITTHNDYSQMMKLTPALNTYGQVGNLSSSLIVFPSMEVRRFCRAYLGAELMDEWIDAIAKSQVSDAEQKRQQNRAQKAVEEIEEWIKDSEKRPGTESLNEAARSSGSSNDKARPKDRVSRWPTLSILMRTDPVLSNRDRQEQQAMRLRLENETSQLFDLFSLKSMKKVYKQHKSAPETWGKIAYDRSGTASGMFQKWNIQATQAWRAASERVRVGIQRTVDQIWPITDNGLDLARIYIDEYDDRLADLVTLLGVWRKRHMDNYQETLDDFQQLADGPWVIPDDQSNIAGGMNQNSGGQAGPTGANINANAGLQDAQAQGVNQPGPGIVGNLPRHPGALHQHLSEREDRIARQLGQRVTWEYNRIPKILNLAVAAGLITPALWLSVLALFPALTTKPLAIVAVLMAIVGLTATLGWAYRWWHQRNVEKTQKDILVFYTRCYVYRCEQREDQLRRLVLGPLHRRTQLMRERLDNMGDFITVVSNGLEVMANQAHDELFIRGPAAVRDIFVGDGARLEPTIRPVINRFEDASMVRLRRMDRRTRRRPSEADSEILRRTDRLADTPTGPLSMSDRRKQERERRTVNTLEDFAEKLHGKRLRNPKDPSHHPTGLRTALLESFQSEPQSFIEMSVEGIQRYVCSFTQEINDEYLQNPVLDENQVLVTNDLVDINRALELEGTWSYAIDRMERPVYHSQGGNLTPALVFICGRKPSIDRGSRFIETRLRDAINVYTMNSDTLLVIGIFRDHSPAELNVDIHFPLKVPSAGAANSPQAANP